MKPRKPTHEGELCTALMRVGTHMASVFDREMAGWGLTQAQFRFLLSLCVEPLSPGQLAERSLLERATVSLVAQRMVTAGWLERLPGPNRRTHLLQLTPAGLEALQASVPAAEDLARRATREFSAAEKATLLELLRRLENHLRENDL